MPTYQLLRRVRTFTILLLVIRVIALAEVIPAPGTWSTTGSLHTARSGHVATLLVDGRVLVAGGMHNGQTLASAEVYDPHSGRWTTTGRLRTPRAATAAVVLPSGKVLIAGGCVKSCNAPTAAVELYDPDTGTWSATGSLNQARYFHTAVLLKSGNVLVAGGCTSVDCATNTATVEVYDPKTGVWSYTSSLHTARNLQSATVLMDGSVLIAGGFGTVKPLASSEIFDPAVGTWSTAGDLQMARIYHTATLLPDGSVVAGGGRGGVFGAVLCSAEIFDPVSKTWVLTGTLKKMVERHSAVLLPNGGVLATGGDYSKVIDGQVVPMRRAQAKTYDATAQKWLPSASMHHARTAHTSTLLGDGQVLVVGGLGKKGDLAAAEVYQP